MKKPLRILLVILLAIVLLFLGYFAYVMLSYSRLEDNLPLDVQGEADKTAAAGVPYNILSYNIGFGAYEPDYGFFMDGGKESWAFSEKRLIANMENIAEFINSQNADICILQEVDQNATRTYHFDEREFLTEKLAGYSSVWAENWNSPFLFYPFIKPHGSTLAGIMTFSMPGISSALRISLPIETGLMKLVDLDRCYSVSRIPVNNGRELVLYNLHLSAYTSDGKIAEEQLKMLIEDMSAEYGKGNYVIGGGDFNKDLLGDSAAVFGVNGGDYTWAQPIPDGMFANTGLTLVVPEGKNGPVPTCRNADGPYNPEQYILTVDGFIVSDNVRAEACRSHRHGFRLLRPQPHKHDVYADGSIDKNTPPVYAWGVFDPGLIRLSRQQARQLLCSRLPRPHCARQAWLPCRLRSNHRGHCALRRRPPQWFPRRG